MLGWATWWTFSSDIFPYSSKLIYVECNTLAETTAAASANPRFNSFRNDFTKPTGFLVSPHFISTKLEYCNNCMYRLTRVDHSAVTQYYYGQITMFFFRNTGSSTEVLLQLLHLLTQLQWQISWPKKYLNCRRIRTKNIICWIKNVDNQSLQ